jgi:hypothetical protein
VRFLSCICSIALCSFAGCVLDRSVHGSGLDGAAQDGGSGDVGPVDAPGIDAFQPDDGGVDTGSTCIPTGASETVCDRIDDDCDGDIDDDNACPGCVAITIAGHPYLSCPGPISGWQAWMGACRTAARGYDLATFRTAGEQNAVAGVLMGRGLTDPHWIGLNDFAASGTYVWRDHSTTFTPGLIGANDPAKRFVVLRADGGYEEMIGNEMHRFLCEGVQPPGPCGAHAEAATCNGIDEDCNGLVDDGLDCGTPTCTAGTFWDRAYYVCTHSRNAMESTQDCAVAAGATLVSIDDPIEHGYLAQRSTSDAWISLAQDADAPMSIANWHWGDGTSTYGIPAVLGVAPWDGGEPDDNGGSENNQENCGALLAPGRMSHFDDRSCTSNLPFLCERPWTW